MLGASSKLLEKACVSLAAKSDEGLPVVAANDKDIAAKFMSAVAKHRFPDRETDPPVV